MSVPALRFKEFSESWKHIEIGDVGDIITGSTPDTGESDFYEGQKIFVSPADMNSNRFISETKTTLTEAGFKQGRKVRAESVLFVCIGSTIGKVAQNKVECITNQQINSVVPNANHSSNFIYSRLERDALKIAMLAGKQAVPIINKTTFSKVKIHVPELLEQTKIANFLTAVDEKITHLTQKHDLLTQYKKGVMQQIFSQELRFKDDDGGDFPKWGGTTLGEVCKPQQWQTISAAELTETGFPAYGANGQIGFYSEYNHEFETVAVTCRGATCGEVNLIPAKSYITGNSMCLDEINCKDNNHRFIYYALKLRGFRDVISGSAQPQIVGSSIRKVNFLKPGLKEQTKIANFLTSIDDKINATQAQLDAVKQYKQGLLQQMFV